MPRPEDSGGPPRPSPSGRLVLASGTLKPSPSATSSSRSCTSTKGERGHPYGLQDTLCTLRPSRVRSHQSSYSAMDATLDTGGWLALPRQGLSPGKHRQASLGAITTQLTCRRGSGGYESQKALLPRRSGAAPGSAGLTHGPWRTRPAPCPYHPAAPRPVSGSFFADQATAVASISTSMSGNASRVTPSNVLEGRHPALRRRSARWSRSTARNASTSVV
jgi:hypothetical protein